MKSKTLILVLALAFVAFTTVLKAQTSIPNGKVRLIEFTNDSAAFTVPEGKAWYIINVFTATGNYPISIYLKSLNDKELTSRRVYGSNVLLFGKEESIIKFPIAFPSGTKFEMIILKMGLINEYSDQTAYLNYIEVDN